MRFANDRIQSGLISRRTAFSLVGVALPATIFAVSQGAAQLRGWNAAKNAAKNVRKGARTGAMTAKNAAKNVAE